MWGAFELREDGSVTARMTLERAGAYEREPRSWGSLEEAERELGPGFGEVARKVRASGSDRWRWRP